MAKKIQASQVEFENGNVFIAGELYGTELQYHEDCEAGKIKIIDDEPIKVDQQ